MARALIPMQLLIAVGILVGVTTSIVGVVAPSDAAHDAAALYAHGDLVGASKILQTALRREPGNAQLRFMLANALFRQRRWDEASRQYREAATRRPAHSDTHLSLGFACYRGGHFVDAVEAWRKAVRTSPSDALPRVALAVGLSQIGQEGAAWDEFRHGARFDSAWEERLRIDIRWTPEMVKLAKRVAASASEGYVATTGKKGRAR